MILANKSITSAKGFTLIELVIVIIVLGLLAATAVPRFIGKSSFEDYTVQDQLIARLRLVQLQNMNADPSPNATRNACYWVVVTADCFYNTHTARENGLCKTPPSANSNTCNSDSYDDRHIVTYSNGMLSADNYTFGQHGKPIAGPSFIPLNGDNHRSISIESEGYIHE
ncbi:type II secretion system protein [Psychromonas sp. MME2]|uniref:pilus assembly FimT family protein n=1 Tax=unclassified Psychromonas TaxID=2614957 RepID=UPI00339BA5D9